MDERIVWVVVAAVCWVIALWGFVRVGRRRRVRSILGPPIDVDEERRRQLRAAAATDYAEALARKRHGRH